MGISSPKAPGTEALGAGSQHGGGPSLPAATGPPSTTATLRVLLARMGQDVAPITLEPPQPLRGLACLRAGAQRESCAQTETPLFFGEFIAAIVQAESRDAQSRRQPGLGCPKGWPQLQRDLHPCITNSSGFGNSPSTPTIPGTSLLGPSRYQNQTALTL